MLAAEVKTQIRQCYKSIASALPNFRSRREQNYMVAEISKTLAGEYDPDRRIVVIEAGTGIGKSLAYLLGTIPLALANNKKVCIATATVTLQEQLLHKDLPFFLQHSELDFKFGLVKGRQRYVCLAKLQMLLGEDNGTQLAMWQNKPDQSQIQCLQNLLQDYQQGKWNGERDSLPQPIPDFLWQQIASDKHSCHRQHASHRHCPFHKARDQIETWDVLIVNHSLLFADLELGGGVILPEPDKIYYVIDEAHHLPLVARDFSSAQATALGACDWLEKTTKLINKLQKQVKSEQIAALVPELGIQIHELTSLLKLAAQYCHQQVTAFDNQENRLRFEHGKLPENFKELAAKLASASGQTFKEFNKLITALAEATKDGKVPQYQSDSLFTDCGFMLQRLENLTKLWRLLAKDDKSSGAPMARWIEQLAKEKQTDYLFCVSPIEVGFMLESLLWEKAAGIVLCSATLQALNRFDHFAHQVGLSLNDGSRYLALQSPFDFKNNATLYLPAMASEPNDESYTPELADQICKLIEDETASLVLFASYWQMEKVAQLIETKLKQPLLIQGTASRQELLKKHKALCDAGKSSVIFGTGSFSEGLDLPGDYLTNLIITKLPFAVPTSAVEEAHAEYIKLKGGNPFLQLTIPDASRKLIQSCGRLLRKEDDYGRITILDRRLVSKHYGSSLLAALPPYRQVIEQ